MSAALLKLQCAKPLINKRYVACSSIGSKGSVKPKLSQPVPFLLNESKSTISRDSVVCFSEKEGKPEPRATRRTLRELRDASNAEGSELSYKPSVPGRSMSASLSASSNTPTVQDLDPDSFYWLMHEEKGLVLVDFYTEWCGPCKLMHKELDVLCRAFRQVKFFKVNVGKHKDFTTRQRIRSLPTFRLYHQGICLEEVTGAKPVILRQVLSSHSMRVSSRGATSS
mmetsp:Transcript_32439/g.58924  ORF Transcript_32439/g.58924 Transcript_32439/m.58924 type:complete len:225 (-) Transcript_32439:631-1305(-)